MRVDLSRATLGENGSSTVLLSHDHLREDVSRVLPAGRGAGGASSWPRWFWPCFAVGLLACALPMAVASVLPFSDLNSQAGIVGALLQRGHPGSHVADYFTFDVHASPNAFYWAVTYVLGKLLPLRAASNLFVIVFCVAGPPLAYLFALRTLDKPPALAFLALAAVFHRCLWFGFVDSVTAGGFLFLEVGFLNRAFARRAWSWWDAGLAGTLLLLATAHAFMFLVGLGLWLLFAACAWRQPSPLYRRLVVAAPALAYLGPWLARTFEGRGRPGTGLGLAMVRQAWRQREPWRSYLTNAHDWFLNGYASSVDEVVAAVFAVTLVAALVAGVRGPGGGAPAAARDRLWEARLPLAAGLLAAGYLLLPMEIRRPISWWAVNVRLLVPLLLTLGLLIPARGLRLPSLSPLPSLPSLPSWALVPLWAAATFYGLYVAHDFRRWWVGVELSGFDAALQAIPPGQRVHALYPGFEGERHYSHFPMGHIVDWYVVDRGGTATPWMTSHRREVWAAPRWRPAAPWAVGRLFSWRRYGPSWDYFLVKQPAPGNGGAFVPFRDAPRGWSRGCSRTGYGRCGGACPPGRSPRTRGRSKTTPCRRTRRRRRRARGSCSCSTWTTRCSTTIA